MEKPILFNPELHADLIPSVVNLHKACIMSPPYTVARFIPPLRDDIMTTWWQDRCKEVETGKRQIIMQMNHNTDTGREDLAGYVMLFDSSTETQPFRGEVEKLLVLPEYRKKGVARALMSKLEEVARVTGREMLYLDTTVGSGAEYMYPKLGYIEYGIVPRAQVDPAPAANRSLRDAMYFYKDLREV